MCPRARRLRLSASSSGGQRPDDPPYLLPFDHSFGYIGADLDPRPLPRLPLHVALPDSAAQTERLRPIVDTGAEYTVFDGNVALRLGWTEDDLRTRAENVLPIFGLGVGIPTLTGYLHRMTCLIPLGDR